MKYRVRIKNNVFQDQYNEGVAWLNANLDNRWQRQLFLGGAVFIGFEREEDKCLFILRYGEFIA